MHIFPSWKIWEGWKNFFSFQIFFSNVKGLAHGLLNIQAYLPYTDVSGLGAEVSATISDISNVMS